MYTNFKKSIQAMAEGDVRGLSGAEVAEVVSEPDEATKV